jgi:hypothetical protein
MLSVTRTASQHMPVAQISRNYANLEFVFSHAAPRDLHMLVSFTWHPYAIDPRS